jgi:hypothetical protein
MSSTEVGFHKLKEPQDYDGVKAKGFRPSAPAESHWLGEGIYFFLNPNGWYWAKRWPFRDHSPRTDSSDGIVVTLLGIDEALDFRDDEIRNLTHKVIDGLKLKLKFAGQPISDGAAFKFLFKDGGAEKLVGFQPTCIIANFDASYEPDRVYGSSVFLNIRQMEIRRTAQIQACVLVPEVIDLISLCDANGNAIE